MTCAKRQCRWERFHNDIGLANQSSHGLAVGGVGANRSDLLCSIPSHDSFHVIATVGD